MSKLIVEICKVDSIKKHPNADKLSVVTIKGWHSIVGLDQYKVGDLVIYCPPDSIIPQNLIDKYNLEFLKKNGRVGTVKLRQMLSEGLVLDLDCLPKDKKYKEGNNVAEDLGITKWEPPQRDTQCMGGRKTSRKKLHPYFDKYTDIENIKNFPNLFKEGEEVVITEKIHGANARYGVLLRYKKGWFNNFKSLLFGKYEFVYGSHNVQITGHRGRKCFYGKDVYAQAVKKLEFFKKWKTNLPQQYIFYGEIYGKGIQDLNYGLEDVNIRFFDIKSIERNEYLNYEEFELVCSILEKELELKQGVRLEVVPKLYQGPFSMDIVKQYTSGSSLLYANQMREGCVIRPIKERVEHMGRVILKSISEDYLLRKNGTEFK